MKSYNNEKKKMITMQHSYNYILYQGESSGR